jgi:hypothetical protein
MKNISEIDSLNQSIIFLENKRAEELILLKEQFDLVHENLRPSNLIKSAFVEITTSPVIKNNTGGIVMGLTSGFLLKKVLVGASRNPFKRILGGLLQFAITNVVSKHFDGIKSTGGNLLQRFIKPKNESEN